MSPASAWGVSLTEKDGVGFGNFSFSSLRAVPEAGPALHAEPDEIGHAGVRAAAQGSGGERRSLGTRGAGGGLGDSHTGGWAVPLPWEPTAMQRKEQFFSEKAQFLRPRL